MNGAFAERDTLLRVQTPEGIEYALYPAGLLIRSCAYGIDLFFQGLFLLAVNILYLTLLRAALGIWLVLLMYFALDWFYHVFWEVFFRGQSLGKRFLGLRVVRSDGSPVGPGSSLIRNLLRFADGFLGLYLTAFLSLTMSRGFRRLGDWAADTLVIYTWQSQAPARRDPLYWLDAFPPALPGRALNYEEKQGVLAFAQRYPLLGPARADEIARPLVQSLKLPACGKQLPAGGKSAGGGDAAFLLGIARTFAASAAGSGPGGEK
ncbi:MAG: RDD family protein [Treponema sp.]|jgi:uncharacterized RDD family membrane protein YckC|nr:RDD family protein [Treponema sp.]